MLENLAGAPTRLAIALGARPAPPRHAEAEEASAEQRERRGFWHGRCAVERQGQGRHVAEASAEEITICRIGIESLRAEAVECQNADRVYRAFGEAGGRPLRREYQVAARALL